MNKKLNKKGFTLIELLAVIVVLGIILAIAIPLVTSSINDSKRGSFKSSAQMVLKEIEKQGTIYDGGIGTGIEINDTPKALSAVNFPNVDFGLSADFDGNSSYAWSSGTGTNKVYYILLCAASNKKFIGMGNYANTFGASPSPSDISGAMNATEETNTTNDGNCYVAKSE